MISIRFVPPASGSWGRWSSAAADREPGLQKKRSSHEGNCAARARTQLAASAYQVGRWCRWWGNQGPANACRHNIKRTLNPNFVLECVSKWEVRCLITLYICEQSPDNINCSRTDFWVAAHDGDTGSKRSVDAEDHTLHAPGQHRQVGLCTGLIPSWDQKKELLHFLGTSDYIFISIKKQIKKEILTWPPFWLDRLPDQASCWEIWCTPPCHCYWSLPCQSAPSGQTEVVSWPGCPPESSRGVEISEWRQGQSHYSCCLFTFSPVSVTMSSGPYMKRPTRVWGPSSVAMTSFTLWFAVTFCGSWQETTVAEQQSWQDETQIYAVTLRRGTKHTEQDTARRKGTLFERKNTDMWPN